MKTFVCSLIIFSLLCTFIFINSYSVSKTLDELLRIASALPDDENDIENGGSELQTQMEKLYSVWDERVNGFAYVMDYNLLDRADEAMIALYCAHKSGNTDDFIYAKANFCDALRRLKILCGVGFESFA